MLTCVVSIGIKSNEKLIASQPHKSATSAIMGVGPLWPYNPTFH